MAKAKNTEGGDQLGSDQIAALTAALLSAKSEGQDIGNLSVADITSLLNLHANAVKAAEAAIPKTFKLLKNHALLRNGRAGEFYAADTEFNSVDHRDLITELVRNGAQLEELQPAGKKESASKKSKAAADDAKSGQQGDTGGDAGGDNGSQQENE